MAKLRIGQEYRYELVNDTKAMAHNGIFEGFVTLSKADDFLKFRSAAGEYWLTAQAHIVEIMEEQAAGTGQTTSPLPQGG